MKIVELIMDLTAASSSAISKMEGYLYFNPRNAHARGTMGGPDRPSSSRSGGDGMPGGLESSGPGTGASFGQRRQGFSEAIVFTVGGGSMDEYGNLQEWVKRTGGLGGGGQAGPGSGATSSGTRNRRVVYGSTELVNASDILEELKRLGMED
jgi:sec1 family domain-containing protein 1